MIIGISGKANSGKDTVADYLAKQYKLTKVALADPLKRFVMEVFDFSEEQLWGSSEKREEFDERYILNQRPAHRPSGEFVEHFAQEMSAEHHRTWTCLDCGKKEYPCLTGECINYLNARIALQKLGTEYGRECGKNVWIDYAMRVCDKLQSGKYDYDPKIGTYPNFDGTRKDVVISDIRFANELARIKEQGVVLRVKRTIPDQAIKASSVHISETEQKEIDDNEFDMVICNDGALGDLYENVKRFMESIDYKNRFDK
jgi:hypothetical protein